ncbi:aromatic acid exporter family protein [Bacillus sp. 2205SS5-2]|uniref:aromatic acid exporter family protein n=1 Tax=Bacillus sp. 2205SS5-2 TaxID=3109031 RepID=UPI003003CEBB
MFKIGYRTIKTAIGTAIAIMIAQWFQLDNFASAGIITILCVQNTRKKSLSASWSRFLACIVAMGFSFAFFEGIAYSPIIIGSMLLFFIPTTVALKAKEGIVTSSVIILHLYSAKQITMNIIFNELGIIIIGIGVALIMNLYMPSLDRKLIHYQKRIERNFQLIFKEIAHYLRCQQSDWKGMEITETAKLLHDAKSIAFRDVENHFLRHEDVYYLYFKMREKQFDILERILPIATSISLTVEQGKILGDFMDKLSEQIHPGNTAFLYLKELYDIKIEFEGMALPQTREEFEARAALFQFMKEMEQYLLLKSSFTGLQKKKKNGKPLSEANYS